MLNTLTIWLAANVVSLTAALVCAVIILLGLIISLFVQLNRLTQKHKSLMSGMEGKDLEEMLSMYLNKAINAEQKVAQLNSVCEMLEEYTRKSLQKVGLVRFNAFEDMGGDMSFAAALLDQQGDGLVISSINSREESRVYAKPITQRTSTYNLSREEKEALSLTNKSK